MKMMQKSLLAMAVLATTAMSAQAASNVDVKVIGSIDPGTCTPTLSGGGTIDYGTMSPSVLAPTGYTLLAEKQLDITINCTAPSKVAIKAVNGRPNTLPEGNEGVSGFGWTNVSLFGATGNLGAAGLGESNGVKVGGYGVRVVPGTVSADGNAVDSLITINLNAPAWTKANTGLMLDKSYIRGTSWATTGTTDPVAFTNLTGKLGVQAYLNEKSAFDLTNTVKLDGLTTLELVYLP